MRGVGKTGVDEGAAGGGWEAGAAVGGDDAAEELLPGVGEDVGSWERRDSMAWKMRAAASLEMMRS